MTIKLDGNWNSFRLANSVPPLSVSDSAVAPSARMHELRTVQVPSRNETSKAAQTLRAMEHTSSMPLKAVKVRQQRLLGRGSHETKALSHIHKHTPHTQTSVYAVRVSYGQAQAFSCTHTKMPTTHILTRRPYTLAAGQALHATLHASWILHFGDGHTKSNAPELFRPPKLSGVGPSQY